MCKSVVIEHCFLDPCGSLFHHARDTERQRGGEQDQGGQAEQRNHTAHLFDHCP